jgi:hypothetical protein
MGIDSDLRTEAKAWEKAGSDALANGDLKIAATDFREAANKLRTAGDFDMSAFDSKRAGDALEREGQIKQTEGHSAKNRTEREKDYNDAKNAHEGAARNFEAAGRTALQGNSPFRFSDAQDHYANAGYNRDVAGVFSQDVNKLEAPKNYQYAHDDYELAKKQGKDAAKAGDRDDAATCDRSDERMDYSNKADLAQKAADDASRALKDPRNKL